MSRALSRRFCALPSLRTVCSQSLPSWRGLSWLPAFLGGSSSHPAAEAQHILLGRKRLVDPYRLAARTSIFVVGAIELCSPVHQLDTRPTHPHTAQLAVRLQPGTGLYQAGAGSLQQSCTAAGTTAAAAAVGATAACPGLPGVVASRALRLHTPTAHTHHLAMHLFCAG